MKIGLSFPEFSAELNTDVCDVHNNADLTITLNLGFKQINPAGGKDEGQYNDYGDATETARKIVKWSPGTWRQWKTDFLTSAQKFWNGKFWLVNNQNAYVFEDNGVKYVPNIYCKFKLLGGDADGTGTFNHTIEVVRLHKDETWFGSHSRLYDSLDTTSVQKGTDSKGTAIMQRAHVHEVGHLLGLPHVDVGKKHCPPGGNTNASKCYGVQDVDKYAVMGQGMQLRAANADPWRRAITEISGKGTVLNKADWVPKLKRHYPRTEMEALTGQAITKPRVLKSVMSAAG